MASSFRYQSAKGPWIAGNPPPCRFEPEVRNRTRGNCSANFGFAALVDPTIQLTCPAHAKTGQFEFQSVSPPTALALPLEMGTSACPAGQLPCETTPTLREVGSAAMSLPGTKRPVRRPRIAAITIHSSPHLAWLTEVTGSKIGRWSVAEV